MRQLKITQQITNKDSKALDTYLREISKESLLSSEEELDLANAIKEGSAHALNRLIRCNLRFVVSVAKQYQNRNMKLEDLINEGNMGLIKAARKFDPSKGFKFISYAVWWIRQSILHALAEKSRTIKLPLNKVNNINRIISASLMLEQKLEREPTYEEISELLSITSDEVSESLEQFMRQVSVDAPIDSAGSEEDSLLDVIANENSPDPTKDMMKEALRIEITKALKHLRNTEAKVLKLFYGLDGNAAMKLEEIGETMDLTRERIRQIKERALRKIRYSSRSMVLRTYL
jgi:RNA polymerase primary sigma factor